MSEEPPPVYYTNMVRVSTGPYDLVLDFGLKLPTDPPDADADTHFTVIMSPAHAKAMASIIIGHLSAEDEHGEPPRAHLGESV